MTKYLFSIFFVVVMASASMGFAQTYGQEVLRKVENEENLAAELKKSLEANQQDEANFVKYGYQG